MSRSMKLCGVDIEELPGLKDDHCVIYGRHTLPLFVGSLAVRPRRQEVLDRTGEDIRLMNVSSVMFEVLVRFVISQFGPSRETGSDEGAVMKACAVGTRSNDRIEELATSDRNDELLLIHLKLSEL